jgi:Na+-translocating ferredoxin:NAD+ oxidoreductase RnfG subunit
MKKSTRLSFIIVATVAVISTAVAAATYIQSDEKILKLEHAARLQNLSVIAINNRDFVLACRAQNEAEKVLSQANLRSEDVVGMLNNSSGELCVKAANAIALK